MTREVGPLSNIEGFHCQQPPSSAVICKKLHVIAMATLRGPVPKGTPWTVYGFLCSSLFEKLTVWPQLVCLCVCVCIVIVITVCCSYNSSAKSLISWWPRRLCPRPAPVFLGLQLVWSHCCGRVGSVDEPRIKSDAFLYEVYIFTNIKQIIGHLINSLRFICKQGE